MSQGNAEAVAHMSALINTTLACTDNAQRKKAENELVKSMKNVAALRALVTVVGDMQQPAGARQMGAVLLRKKVLTLWRSLSHQEQAEMRLLFLQYLSQETERVVRLAITHLITSLAKVALDDGWPELTAFLQQAMQSDSEGHRELVMILVYSLSEAVEEKLATHVPTIGALVVAGLNDPVRNVRVAALQAVAALTVVIENMDGTPAQGAFLNEIIPVTLEVVRKEIAVPDAEMGPLIKIMTVLEEIVDLRSTGKAELILSVLHFMIEVASNKATPQRIRDQAMQILVTMAQNKPKFLTKNKVVPALVTLCLDMMSEDEYTRVEYNPGEEEESDGEEITEDTINDTGKPLPPCMCGSWLLGELSHNIPSKVFYPLVSGPVGAVMENPSSSHLSRKAAILALASIAKACSGRMRRQIKYIVQLTQTLMDDPAPCVREAAAISLTYFCEYLQPEILKRHAVLYPMLIRKLQDPNDEVRSRVCGALDGLCENTQQELEPYIPELMDKLVAIIPQSSLTTQKSICSAFSSIAEAQCPAFQRFAPDLLELLKGPIAATTPEAIPLRAQVTETVGIIGTTMGKEAFLPYFDFFSKHVMEGFSSKFPELKEESFGFMANMAELLKDDFLPLLPAAMDHISASVSRDPAKYYTHDPLAAGKMCIGEDASSGEESEGEDGTNDNTRMRVRTADVDEQAAAVYALGVFAENLREKFQPYIGDCTTMLELYINHYHELVQENTLISLGKFALALHGSEPFPKKVGVPTADEFSPNLREYVDTLMEHMIGVFETDESKKVCAAACDVMVEIVGVFGSMATHTHMDTLCDSLEMLLRCKGSCQIAEDVDMADETVTVLPEDHDAVLMDHVVEVVDALAEAYGPAFAPYFTRLGPPLLLYCDANRPGEDHVMATGTLANCVVAMKGASEPFYDACLGVLHQLATSEEFAARGNCAFLCRALIESVPSRLNAQVATAMLNFMSSLVGDENEAPEAIDNAISATCSLVRIGAQFIPVEQVLPTLLDRLPLNQDKGENANIVNTLTSLVIGGGPLLEGNLERVVGAIGRVALSTSCPLTREEKDALGTSFRMLAQRMPGPVQAAVQNQPNAVQALLVPIASPPGSPNAANPPQ